MIGYYDEKRYLRDCDCYDFVSNKVKSVVLKSLLQTSEHDSQNITNVIN